MDKLNRKCQTSKCECEKFKNKNRFFSNEYFKCGITVIFTKTIFSVEKFKV